MPFTPSFKTLLTHLLLLALLAFPTGAMAYDLKNNAIAHARNGQLLLERDRPAEAIDEFKAALLLNPYTSLSAAIYNNLGLAYRAVGNYPYAFASFQRACRIQPTFSYYYKNLIETYAAAGRLGRVESALQKIVTKNPDNAEAWFMLGLLYKEQGNRKQGKLCFDKFLKLEPESEMATAARNAF